MNLLLLSTGRRVSLIRRLKLAALRLEIPLQIFGTDMESKTSSLHFCDQQLMVPPTKSPEYLPALISILKEHKVDAILPGNDLDLEFLCEFQLPESLSHIKLLYSGPERTGMFLRKSLTTRFFQELGLDVPRVFDQSQDARFPAIIKEDRGHGSRGQYLLEDETDLLSRLPKAVEPFMQDFIEGPEYTIDVFSNEQYEPVNVLPRIREKVRSGISDVGRVHMDKNLLELLSGKLQEFRLTGPWNLQCILHDNRYYFLEVNPRFSGGIPLTIEAGMDFCQNALEWAMGLEPKPFTDVRDGMVMMKYDAELFA
ncbi:ATP-grasp domain-containing protein [bacterium]|jgi:carbamoyl-phosphate synthase large subunit|nr:ATP-grasp domain-containing protein [bacterium]